MNRVDEWVQFVAKQLKSEADLVGAQAKHELYEDVARGTFIRVALEPFLPDNFAIGCGRIVDAAGNSSNKQDIIVYQRNFPQFNLPDNANVFLYESVLATFSVKSKLIRKSFNEALDQCASVAGLAPAIAPAVMQSLALKNELRLNDDNQYVHANPLRTQRFDLVGRPLSFVYAFSGYQTKPAQLTESIEMWINHRRENGLDTNLKHLPATIATQGCFAWRNAAPFALKNNILLGTGSDSTPVRLIFLQLMHALNRRLQVSTDSHGLRLNIDPYIRQIKIPDITGGIGNAVNPGNAHTTRKQDSKPQRPTLDKAPVSNNTTAPVKPEQEPTAPPAIVTSDNVSRPGADDSHPDAGPGPKNTQTESDFIESMKAPKPEPETDRFSQTIPQ